MDQEGPDMRLTPLLAAFTLSLAPHATADLDLEFEGDVDRWQVVLDGVMGGLSSGQVTKAAPGVLAFAGTLSMENNGGFSQVRRPVSGDAFAGADGIEVKVRGDGRRYIFDLRASNARVRAGSYQRTFDTIDGTWITVRLPFNEFRLHSFGQQIRNAPALTPTMIESLGVTLADKIEGSFQLEIDAIRTYSDEPSESAETISVASDDEVRALIELAINRGAPLFNDGQHAACAAVYEMTIRSIVALGADAAGDDVIARLQRGLDEGDAASTWIDRAWAYRRAFDDSFALLITRSRPIERTASK